MADIQAAPEGLDEFLSTSQPEQLNTTEPQGLDEFLAPELKEQKYGTTGQQLKAGAEGLAQGLVGPLAPLAERAVGVKPEDILGRQETNPVTHYASEIAGIVGPALLTGGASGAARLTQTGALEAIGRMVPAASETLASRVGTGAAKAAVENIMLAGSDEASKMILQDPNQTAQTALGNIGIAAALGGALGGTVGGISPLWEATVGDKAGKFIEDFKGRIKEHVENPDPVHAVTDELSQYHKQINGLADEVYGPTGLKAKDIEATLPKELNDKILDQRQEISDKLSDSIQSMRSKPNSYPERLVSKLEDDLKDYQSAVSKDNVSPSDVFSAAQDLKQQLQGYSKFDKFVKPVDEAYDFVSKAKGLAFDLRSSLEDPSVWGKAAQRQQSINKAFREYLPTLQDFQKKFTTELNGEKVIDPTKVNTYINQLGKPNAEIKQSILRNFLDASEKYKKVLNDTHANLGIETPVQNVPMNSTLSTLGDRTLGGKVADAFIQRGLTEAGGKSIGAAIGGGLGAVVGGHGGAALGAILGQHALGPFFSSILPGIAKALTSSTTSTTGFRATTDYAANAVKGYQAMSRATASVFKTGTAILPQIIPSEKDTAKLDKLLAQVNKNPDLLLNSNNKVGQILPDHASAMDQSVAQAVTYLNSLRTDLDKKAPLDSKPVPSTTQKAVYQNALQIAEKPLILLDRVRQGTLTSSDIQVLGSLYPSLYNGIKTQLMEQITKVEQKGQTIPYRTRISLSMFLAQPLDSTMTPEAISSAQLIHPGDQSQQPQQETPKGSKSSPALQKLPSMYRTPSETREARKNKDV